MTISSIRFTLLLVTLRALLSSFTGCKDPNRKIVNIGYMNCNNEQETKRRFLTITRYLSDKVGGRVCHGADRYP